MVVRGYFLKKRKLYMQNLMKEWKQPPVVILQKSIFYNIFIRYLWIRIFRRSDQGFQFMNFFSQTFSNDINRGYRAAVLKKSSLRLLPFYSYLKRCAERWALQLYRTSLKSNSARCNSYHLSFILKISIFTFRIQSNIYDGTQLTTF